MDSNKIDEVIGQLVKIENAATKIQDQTEHEKEEYTKFTEDRIKEFDETLEEDTSKLLTEIRLNLDKKREEDLLAIRESIREKIRELEKSYEENHDRWVDEIVERIIKE